MKLQITKNGIYGSASKVVDISSKEGLALVDFLTKKLHTTSFRFCSFDQETEFTKIIKKHSILGFDFDLRLYGNFVQIDFVILSEPGKKLKSFVFGIKTFNLYEVATLIEESGDSVD